MNNSLSYSFSSLNLAIIYIYIYIQFVLFILASIRITFPHNLWKIIILNKIMLTVDFRRCKKSWDSLTRKCFGCFRPIPTRKKEDNNIGELERKYSKKKYYGNMGIEEQSETLQVAIAYCNQSWYVFHPIFNIFFRFFFYLKFSFFFSG